MIRRRTNKDQQISSAASPTVATSTTTAVSARSAASANSANSAASADSVEEVDAELAVPAFLNEKISRRGLLIGTSATGALLVGTYLSRGPLVRQIAKPLIEAEGKPNKSAGSSRFDMWYEVPPEGNVVLYTPKAEMGQGIHTAFAQIAAEDLDLRMDQLEVRSVTIVQNGSETDSRGFGGLTNTSGSTSVNGSYAQIRMSAHTLKEMLLLEGAAQLEVARADVVAFDGVVQVSADLSKRLPYGTIVENRKGALGTWKAPSKLPPLKPRSDFTLIGTNATRVDGMSKVTGTAVYGFDARLEGLHYGAVARPPRYRAKLVKAEVNGADSAPGVIKVVVDIPAGFVGVVGVTRKRAYEALSKIECTWEGGSAADNNSISRQMKEEPKGFDLYRRGDPIGKLKAINSADVLEQQYFVPAAAHAHLEPLSAMADVQQREAHVWVSTQEPTHVANEVASALKRKRPVVVHTTYLGGGFGRKVRIHVAHDAVRLSEASGKPVQVAMNREEDMAVGPFRAPVAARLRGAVSNGRIVAVDQRTTSAIGDNEITKTVKTLGLDIGEFSGVFSPYSWIPNYRVNMASVDVDIPTIVWRGVGLLPNSFAIESFMDELALLAKADPLQFRLDHLAKDQVGKNSARLLKEVAKRSGWGTPLGEGQGRGIGVAVNAGTVLSVVVQVTVAEKAISVDKVWACVDPGLVINPAGAELQIAGGIMMGLSSAFGEQVSFKNGIATNTNFDSYAILRPNQAPPIDIHLRGSGDTPGGIGEPGVGPICGSLANAVFAATGQRLRTLPLQLS